MRKVHRDLGGTYLVIIYYSVLPKIGKTIKFMVLMGPSSLQREFDPVSLEEVLILSMSQGTMYGDQPWVSDL